MEWTVCSLDIAKYNAELARNQALHEAGNYAPAYLHPRPKGVIYYIAAEPIAPSERAAVWTRCQEGTHVHIPVYSYIVAADPAMYGAAAIQLAVHALLSLPAPRGLNQADYAVLVRGEIAEIVPHESAPKLRFHLGLALGFGPRPTTAGEP